MNEIHVLIRQPKRRRWVSPEHWQPPVFDPLTQAECESEPARGWPVKTHCPRCSPVAYAARHARHRKPQAAM